MKQIIQTIVICSLLFFHCGKLQAQETRKSLSECIEMALKNNLQMQAAELDVQQAKALRGTAFNPEKTSISYEQDPLTPDWIDKKVSITQSVEFPTVYAAQGKMLKEEALLAEKSQMVSQNEVTKNVSEAYFNLCHAMQITQLLQRQDSIYKGFIDRATIRFNAGETNRLELMNAHNRYQENRLQMHKAKADLANSQLVLQQLLCSPEPILPPDNTPQKLPDDFLAVADTTDVSDNPLVEYYNQRMNVGKAHVSVEKSKFMPDLFGGYSFNDTKLPGFQVGISVPIFFGANRAKFKAAKIRSDQLYIERQQAEQSVQLAYSVQYNEYVKAKESLTYYQTIGMPQAEEIMQTAQTAYQLGEIGYMEYIQNLQTAIGIKIQTVDALNQFNQSIIVLNYLKGEK
ncbi:hypothetical protein FACS1894199_02490 [Bacteroidia bacterium]|nr:hypothetical protein FACS1894199_02490 [Bacteroidia bacterium]